MSGKILNVQSKQGPDLRFLDSPYSLCVERADICAWRGAAPDAAAWHFAQNVPRYDYNIILGPLGGLFDWRRARRRQRQ